jgi:hypothetical protein
MPTYINVTIKNDGPGQRVYHAIDLVMRQQALGDTPLDPNETAPAGRVVPATNVCQLKNNRSQLQ